ncbi:MAG TPA: amino acid racemase [Burkholderiales bacterium]|nr:amino acid racemase [Burkholderiales bacterium]
MARLLGVLGGMGPLATADFFRKLIEETPAQRDEQHVPVVVYSVPQMPSRENAITHGSESPLPQMLAGMTALSKLEVGCVAIPCNTAHYWYDELQRSSQLPILHIADAACDELRKRGGTQSRVGLLCTEATIVARIYHDRLAAHDIECVLNTPAEREELVRFTIDAVKRGSLEDAGRMLERAAALLFERGIESVILGCTELPVALDAIRSAVVPRCIDATRALARECVAWSLESRRG